MKTVMKMVSVQVWVSKLFNLSFFVKKMFKADIIFCF